MVNSFMGQYLVADMEKGTCTREPLPEEVIEEYIGGAPLNLKLYKDYEADEPIVIGSGILTSTFTPSSCLGVLTAKSPITGKVEHVPITWLFGTEIKLTGYDFIVIKGAASSPKVLWVHDELGELADGSTVWGLDVWKTVDHLRHEYGDDYIQTLSIGKAGENGHNLAALVESYWGSKDKVGMGALFGKKNLKAVALRGLGSLEVPDGFFEKFLELQKKILSGPTSGKKGYDGLFELLGVSADGLSDVKAVEHRASSCHNCTFPCNSFFMTNEDPTIQKASENEEPGVMVTDPTALLAFAHLGKDAPKAIERASKLGLEPVGAASLAKADDLEGTLKKLDELTESGPSDGYTPPACWPGIDHNAAPFSAAVHPGKDASAWSKTMKLAYTIGVCPTMAVLSGGELNEESLQEMMRMELDDDSFNLVEKLEGLEV